MDLPRDLGDGLALRRAETQADIERIIELDNTVVQEPEPDVDLSGWIRAMAGGDHPTTTLRDFYVVEDTTKDLFVSSMCLIPQVWAYEGIPFGMGRPEIVMTLPDYRRRGLVRAQFEALHADCAARGLSVQGITGIPYFYRLFGYEYALELGGGHHIFFDMISKLKDDETEPYTIREATAADIPALMAMAEAFGKGKLVTCRRDEAYWRFVIHEEAHVSSDTVYLIEKSDGGATAGFLTVGDESWGAWVTVSSLVLSAGVAYTAVMPSLLRALQGLAEAGKHVKPEPPTRRIFFELGREHPAYAVIRPSYQSRFWKPYAWYIRVPDVPGFVRHIAPALERRLAESPAAGYTGEIRANFYRQPGLSIKLEDGKLAEVDGIELPVEQPNARFPPLVFLQLLFGYRSLEELGQIYPDAGAWGDANVVLDALFPKRPSWVMQLH